MKRTMTPFNGDFYDSDGNVRNLLELGASDGRTQKDSMSPFNGNFYASDGSVHNLEELIGYGGGTGCTGKDGWTPMPTLVADGDRIVMQIDWTGGTGTKPSSGLYMGASGYVSDIALAIDLRGTRGLDGIFVSESPPENPASVRIWFEPVSNLE